MAGKESTPSEKAADRIHADLSAMRDTARRYAGLAGATDLFNHWHKLSIEIESAQAATLPCMSERDRKIAAR